MIDYKLADFLYHTGIDDVAFQDILSVIKPSWTEGPWVAGGSIRRLISGTSILESDFDVFFASQAQLDAWLERIRTTCEVLETKSNDFNTTLKVKAVVEKDVDTEEGDTISVKKEYVVELQAIHVQFYGNAQNVIDSFDFTICQLVTDGEELSVGSYTLWDIARKRLVIHKITYAVASMRRMLKYGSQGFHICGGMMAEFLGKVVENPETIDMNFSYID